MSQSGYKVSDLVKAAGVSRQAYYKWLTHEPTVHDIQDQEILKLVKQLEAQHKHWRVSRMLCKKGNFARMNWQF